MKRKKIFLAKKLQFFCGIPYFPFLIFWIIVIVRQPKTMQSSSVLWLIIGLILFSIVELPFFLIPGTATIRFYDDYISYKKNLFVKPTIIYDNKIISNGLVGMILVGATDSFIDILQYYRKNNFKIKE